MGVTTLASGQCACPAGMYTASVGQTSCTACESGKYRGNTASTECTDVAGDYACLTGDTDGTGVTTLATGTCACPAGYYANGQGNTECTEVTAGNYACLSGDSDGEGEITQATDTCACPAGKYTRRATGRPPVQTARKQVPGKHRHDGVHGGPARVLRVHQRHGSDLCSHRRDPGGCWLLRVRCR